ncbi:MAG: ABC transporter permease [Planctomycetes bacterium]|nr:ABC transporter permease [Planctomycetota bacterium]
MTAEAREATALVDEGPTYSKDYWDLVGEQLRKRTLFKVGMAVLAVLYGLAIFAPLIGNDRPYKLVAVNYGEYESAARGVERLSSNALERIHETGSDLPERAQQSEREVTAALTRIALMRQFLGSEDRESLDSFKEDLKGSYELALVGEQADAETGSLPLQARARQFATEFASAPLGSDPDAPGKHLQPSTRYPLAEGLGWGSVFFMVLWVLLSSFPLWNRIWNKSLEGDRERIRDARGKKRAVLLGTPVAAALLWVTLVGGGAPAFDVSPFKRGLSDGSIVAFEAPVLPPVPIGYAETHKEEGFRPPTWLVGARLDSNGRYMQGLRVPKPDPITGYLPPATPVEVRFGEAWPNAPHRHLAGTDELGRDFFVRLLWGGRVSLAVGILSAVLLTLIGVFMGSLAGYFGGKVDVFIMRLIEILQSIPAFFLILAALAFIDPKEVSIPPIFIIVVVIALVRWTGAARLVRGEFLRLREEEFVLAANALGFSNMRTIFRHVLPNALSPVLVNAAFAVASGILTESAVSFLGFGVQHPEASWGSLVNESKSPEFWWIQVFPGVLIFLTVTCYNLVGDAVRDALDPKMKV